MILKNIYALGQDLPEYKAAVWGYLSAIFAWVQRNSFDIAIASGAAAVMFAFIFSLSMQLPQEMVDWQNNIWIWFNADIVRVSETLLDRDANNWRSQVHPLQPILTNPPVQILRILGLSDYNAVMVFGALTAGLWAAVFYSVFRGIGLARVDSLIFTALGAVSSCSVFIFTVPEIYCIGSISVLVVFAMLTVMKSYQLPPLVHAIISAVSFSITSTNWMAGILASFSTNQYRQAFRITFDALLIVTLVFAIQKIGFYRTEFFIPNIGLETEFVLHELAGSPFDRIKSFFLFDLFMPPIPPFSVAEYVQGKELSVQFLRLFSMSPAVLAMLLVWVVILLFGLRTALTSNTNKTFVNVVCLFVLFQLAFHFVWGDEIFLYSANFLPALIIIASFGTFTQFRPLILIGALMLVGMAGYNNITELFSVIHDLEPIVAEIAEKKLVPIE